MPQNPSCGNPSRLRNYVALAATPAVTMSMSSASADIVYQSLDVSVDVGALAGEGSFSTAVLFSIAGAHALRLDVIAPGSNSFAWGFARFSDYAGTLAVASQTEGPDRLVRFDSGETINSAAFANEFSTFFAIGGGSTKERKPVNFKVSDGTASGYVGFAMNDANIGAVFGWISVSWDDVTRILSLDGYAYETDGSGIVAGAGLPPAVPAAPGALGLVALAAGAAGVRRQRAC